MKPMSYANAAVSKPGTPPPQIAQPTPKPPPVLAPTPEKPVRIIERKPGETSIKTLPKLLIPPPEFATSGLPFQTAEYLSAASDIATSSIPSRAVSPLPSHQYVVDAASLRTAVALDSAHIFDALQNLVQERDVLRAECQRAKKELKSVSDDFAHSRNDWETARQSYEELIDLGGKKQVVLWKFIERLGEDMACGEELKLILDPPQVEGKAFVVERRRGDELGAQTSPEGIEEGSEPGTEKSFWSADESLGGSSLDPHAQAFVPGPCSPLHSRPIPNHAKRSPGKRHYKKFNESSRGRSPPKNDRAASAPSPTKANTLPRYELPPQLQNYPVSNAPTTTLLNVRIASLPAHLYGICPHSLVYSTLCPLGERCNLQPVCEEYNDEKGPGCQIIGTAGSCPYAHEFRNCMHEAEDRIGGCWWGNNSIGELGGPNDKAKRNKVAHYKCRVHKTTCNKTEWEARQTVLGLRDAHGKGLYN